MEKLGLSQLQDFFAGTPPTQTPPAQPPPAPPSSSGFSGLSSSAVDPFAAAEPFDGLYGDDSDKTPLLGTGPSALDKVKKTGGDLLQAGKKGVNTVKKYSDHADTLAAATPTGKALNAVSKVTGTADKLAHAFPPAMAITKPVNQAVSAAKNLHKATKVYDIHQQGDAQPLIANDETEEAFERQSDYDDLVDAGARSDDPAS